jgi:hypothetical protein
MKLRFSIRTALLVITGFGCFLYYWGSRPTILANELKRTLAEKNFENADTLLKPGSGLHFIRFSNASDLSVDVEFDEPTIVDWLMGRRFGVFHLTASPPDSDFEIGMAGTLTATASGIDVTRLEESRNDIGDSDPVLSFAAESLDAILEWTAELSTDIASSISDRETQRR